MLERQPHHVAGAGIADHRDHHVQRPVQGGDTAHRHGFLADAEPRLADDPLPHPALEPYVLQPGEKEVPVEAEESVGPEPLHPGVAPGILLYPAPVVPHQNRVRPPVPVLGRVEGRVSLQG